MDPPQSLPPMSFQFRPAVPAQQSQQFIPAASHPFQPVGIGRGIPPMNVALPPGAPQAPQPFYSQPMQQFPPRGGHPIPLPVPHPHPNAQTPNGFTPGVGGPGMPLSSSFTFVHPYGQSSFNTNTQNQSVPQSHATYALSNGQPISSAENQSSASVTPQQQSAEQPSMTNVIAPETSTQPNLTAEAISDWREHTSPDGRKYYYNRRTKLSSWEKPVELMTPTERADASTNWKEFTSPDGKKYYYNKATKESKWVIPEELKLVREQVAKTSLTETQQKTFATSSAPTDSVSSPAVESVIRANTSAKAEGTESSPVSAEPNAGANEHQALVVSRSSSSPVVASPVETSDGDHGSASIISTSDTTTEGVGTAANVVTEPMNNSSSPTDDTNDTSDGVSAQYKEEASNDVIRDKTEDAAPEDKAVDREPLSYANKLEAKNAFMALLDSANVGSDWTWDRAMRVIINDKRYGALKTLGERKQAFNEFLGQRKKQDVEERRLRQKRAREEFKKMLEESTELTSSTRWSKVESLFESDERFKAVERDRDRRDLFESHIEELKKEERAKAQEERRRNMMEYRQFLKSCDFIKANSQWRKVQDRLEADERCSRLEKIDRLENFQEYINDLEREEEEQRKIQKEELRRVERKNRDEFRKLMEDHVAAGIFTAKMHWRDYCMKVKDLPAYLAVVSNTSGATPKDLFDDVLEELQRQYQDDKTRIKDAIKLEKITLSSASAFSDFKNLITSDIGSPPVSDVNLKLVFDELLERVKEKEEKEAKKLKRLKDDFSKLLSCIKEITASSEWENCKSMLSQSHTYSSIGDESLCQQIFEKYVMQLKEQAKEREQKRKDEKARKEKEREERERSKAKQRKEKDAGRTKEKEEHSEKDGGDNETADLSESHVSTDNRRLGKDSSGKHRKRHHDSEDHTDENENEESKKSHGSSSSHKKSRRHISVSESDQESRHRRHRRDHRHGSRRNGDHNELEDGEFGVAAEDS